MQNRRSTIKDVAKLSNVSISVVSYVLNNNQKVKIKPETRERILKAAKELNYIPNTNARNMRMGRAPAIGFISLWSIDDTLTILDQTATAANEIGLSTVICSRQDESFDFVSLYHNQIISGLIFVYSYAEEDIPVCNSIIEKIKQSGIPTVMISGVADGPNIDRIIFDYETSCKIAVERLVSLGHKEIAYIDRTLENDLNAFITRKKSYISSMQESGLTPRIIDEEDAPQTLEAIKNGNGPTALITPRPVIGHNILSKAYKLHMHIPEDFSIISCSFSTKNVFSEPKLTSSVTTNGDIGKKAVELLNRRISDNSLPPKTVTISCGFYEGESCGKPNR